jgi:hypothetical protein
MWSVTSKSTCTKWATSRRAHSCAPEQASMPITQGYNPATTPSSWSRRTVRFTTTCPDSLTLRSENTLFARSIPTAVTFCMSSPLVFSSNADTSILAPRCRVGASPLQVGEVPFIR